MPKSIDEDKIMTKKEEGRTTMISLSRHNSIIKHLLDEHGEEVMKLRDKITELGRKPAANSVKPPKKR